MLIIKDPATGNIETSSVIVDDEITAQERSNLNQILVKLRDAALLKEGYIDI